MGQTDETAGESAALTPGEWSELLNDREWLGTIQQELGDLAGELVQQRMGTGRAHAAAAIALYGQPFGFTREDMALLAGVLPFDDEPGYVETYMDVERIAALNSLYRRIAMLVPSTAET